MSGRGARAIVASIVLTSLPSVDACAAKWEATADIALRQTYTDNVALSAPPESDHITQVTPGIRLLGSGPRFTANLHYSPSALHYARRKEANGVANSLGAFGRVEAVEGFFFVEASGSVSQNFISPVGPRPADITTLTDNRTETRTFGISPYVRGQLQDDVSYELRHRNLWTSTDAAGLADVRSGQWTARIAGPPRRLSAAIEYEQGEIRYEDEGSPGRPDQENRLLRSRLYFRPDLGWRFFASAGREENNYVLQRKNSYRIYGAGASWRPTPRTLVDLEYESRFFGPSRLARLSHRTRLTAWHLAYSRNASSFQQELLRLPPGDTAALLEDIFAARFADPLARRSAVEQFMRASGTPPFLAGPLSFYTQRIFLGDAVEGSLGILGARNSITLTAFRSRSTALSDTAGTGLPDTFLAADAVTQRGFGVRAEHRLTPFTTLAASARRTYARQEPSLTDSRDDFLALSVTHRLSPYTVTSVGLAAADFSSSDAAFAQRDAKSAFVGLTHRF